MPSRLHICLCLLAPMSFCRGVAIPTHILYAYDILIFCFGTKKNICCLQQIFDLYSIASGQVINYDKCCLKMCHMQVYFLNHMSEIISKSAC